MKRFCVKAEVFFFSPENGGRPVLPIDDGYAPYVRTIASEKDLPIRVNGLPLSGGKYESSYEVELELMYHPKTDYSCLIAGSSFELVEGPMIVGKGVVKAGICECE